MRQVVVWLVVIGLSGALAQPAAGMTQNEMCQQISRDITVYLSTGHPCPCPYSTMRDGHPCGNLSAWAKPGGKAPRCYLQDVDGTLQPNLHPNPVRERWPEPPPCNLTD